MLIYKYEIQYKVDRLAHVQLYPLHISLSAHGVHEFPDLLFILLSEIYMGVVPKYAIWIRSGEYLDHHELASSQGKFGQPWVRCTCIQNS